MPLSQLIDHFNDRIRREQHHDLPDAALQLRHRVVEGRFGHVRITSVFQPVLRAANARSRRATGRVIGHAALLRAYAADETALGPEEMFVSTTDTPAIYLLDRLCRTVHLLNYLAGRDDSCCLFLHVDPRCVLSREHGRLLEEDLRHCGLPPQRVVLQVRDKGVQGEDFFQLAEQVVHYRSLGYRVAAVEDTAISHSGLEHLWRLPPDLVKLDHGLIVGAVQHDWECHRLTTLVSTMHHLGAQVFQDGIANEEQAQIAAEAGVDLIKGHYFGKPYPASGLSALSCAPFALQRHPGISALTGVPNDF